MPAHVCPGQSQEVETIPNGVKEKKEKKKDEAVDI